MNSSTPSPSTAASVSASNCSVISPSNNKKIVQYGQKLFHGEGHELILESHDDSARNAFIYIGLILFLYLMAIIAIAIRYLHIRSNRDLLAFTAPNHISKHRRHSSSAPLTAPAVVVTSHIIRIENVETHTVCPKVLQETEL